MIAANELRIGNWVNYDSDDTPFCVIEIAISGISVKNSEEETWIEIDQFSPIPLSSEILEKCGFICENANEDDRYYHLRLSNEKYCDLSFITGDKNGFMEVCLFPYETYFRYQYLHQIQNLYFTLTNEELKINL